MTQYVFGTGQVYSMPAGGGAPLRIGALQDVSVDLSADTKELFGQNQFALDTARGKTKVEWKAASGNIDVEAFNSIFFGQTVTQDSELLQAINEAGAVPAMATYTITVANDGAGVFVMDLGVSLVTTGEQLKQVPGAPGAGEYSVSALGVYTFNVAQASAAVLINYAYNGTTTGSGSLLVTNQLMGSTPKLQLFLSQRYSSKTFSMLIFSCVADKLSLPLKQDDYLISELSGTAHANDAGNVLRLTTTSASGGGG